MSQSEKEWKIRKIRKLKFNHKNLLILVVWENTKIFSKTKPKLRRGIKLVKQIRKNRWDITWTDSWIPVTSLTQSGDAWNEFYKTKIIPFIESEYDGEDIIIQ